MGRQPGQSLHLDYVVCEPTAATVGVFNGLVHLFQGEDLVFIERMRLAKASI